MLIADEPTTALDVTIQAQILEEIKQLRGEGDSGVIFVTHDLGVVADIADRVLVMYGGRVVEQGTLDEIFYDPQHPYTWGLLGSITRMDRDPPKRLPAFPASRPRCSICRRAATSGPAARTRSRSCREVPALEARVPEAPDHRDRCWLDLAEKRVAARGRAGASGSPRGRDGVSDASRLQADREPTAAAAARGRAPQALLPDQERACSSTARSAHVHAVDDVSLSLPEGQTLGIVGESGCGKTTLARCMVRLLEPTDGRAAVPRPRHHPPRPPARCARSAREVQLVFQDPVSSLNPRKRVGQIVGTPLRAARDGAGQGPGRGCASCSSGSGLNPEHVNRFPHEFSGGQRQRIGVARALAVDPRLIVLDEPVSALDVSIQAQVINLLDDLQDDFGLSYVFIAHDLSVVRHVSDRIAVMYLGKIVELSPAEELYGKPIHPYTQALLAAIPIPDPAREPGPRAARRSAGEPPNPINPPTGCRFHTRCPRATDVCKEVEPPLAEYRGRARSGVPPPAERARRRSPLRRTRR